MKRNNSEMLVLLAIKAGYSRAQDISEHTGLEVATIRRYTQLLRFEFNVPSTAMLVEKFSTPRPQPSDKPRFTSKDCVIIDASLSPALAASMLVQVLGEDYCTTLAAELHDKL